MNHSTGDVANECLLFLSLPHCHPKHLLFVDNDRQTKHGQNKILQSLCIGDMAMSKKPSFCLSARRVVVLAPLFTVCYRLLVYTPTYHHHTTLNTPSYSERDPMLAWASQTNWSPLFSVVALPNRQGISHSQAPASFALQDPPRDLELKASYCLIWVVCLGQQTRNSILDGETLCAERLQYSYQSFLVFCLVHIRRCRVSST
ncbi:hypothetical protein B0T10DRAFT_324023 [Thelonectria olida]|uniref:Uncharacterized protein n=1 Tax=Thelonectria olida TaxID=1576542 RepID=A0A9P8W8G0_9HYPO|nr:hypothetical protein B0T10DRAFT_324023 [Thelonectria olida]